MSTQQYANKLEVEIKEILGLDELKSKLYLELLKSNPLTASALAKKLDTDRAGVYRSVERMIEKNLFLSTSSRPRFLVPVDPKKAIKIMLERKEGEIKKIKQSGQIVVKKINEKVLNGRKTTIPTLKIIQGRENIYSEIAQTIESCKDVVFIVTTHKDLIHMSHTLVPQKIQTCKKNGGRVFLMIEGEELDVVPTIRKFNATETRICKMPTNGRIIACRDEKMIMSNFPKFSDNSSMDYSVSTNSKDMVNNIDNLCKLLWRSSKSPDMRETVNELMMIET